MSDTYKTPDRKFIPGDKYVQAICKQKTGWDCGLSCVRTFLKWVSISTDFKADFPEIIKSKVVFSTDLLRILLFYMSPIQKNLSNILKLNTIESEPLTRKEAYLNDVNINYHTFKTFVNRDLFDVIPSKPEFKTPQDRVYYNNQKRYWLLYFIYGGISNTSFKTTKNY
ncbi:hypothetical protein A3Q56_05591 [Intoshia linei]|uniref:Uncharacterized protein n=1 Tax=Intoshia linei TaxID=1819745 RepID=A0A177AXE2_9BILA|nr:hypothetical protein A3Q56_05591 [Intoshia linei]